MVQAISAEKVTLYDLEQQFGLIQVENESFFSEWQTDLLPLTEAEQQRLERVRSAYENLARRSILENTVNLVVVSPLLDLAGLFFPPFYISTEVEAQVEVVDRDTIIRGKIDVLVIKEQLWILVIESKQAELSLKVGIPQALTYMLAAPSSQRSLYGMVTNGSNFVFLKLERQEFPYYGRSREFVLENRGDLESVLQVMKRLATLVGVE
ncbi:MAG: restriction endonuclease subunit R [Oscillatoriales cyanobacterium C42_A2020_001]|nr:restriction endonuclease subunit R [Leptolyngbyaceae cyanobacterium C42_A2020_001]